jgi:hypothetical protein
MEGVHSMSRKSIFEISSRFHSDLTRNLSCLEELQFQGGVEEHPEKEAAVALINQPSEEIRSVVFDRVVLAGTTSK